MTCSHHITCDDCRKATAEQVDRQMRMDELANFRMQVMQIVARGRKQAAKATLEDMCDAIDAVRDGRPKPAIFQ